MVLSQPISRNAKVGAVALAGGALSILALSHFTLALAPLRLLSVALSAFAAWCFCEEMGLGKPLNRAGFVFFVIAAVTKVELLLGVAAEYRLRYYLLYSAFLLAAVLFWSVALLHRQRTLKVVGAVGVIASLTPIVALIVGHVVVGAGAFLGVGALLAGRDGAAPTDLGFVTLIERVFGLWGYAAAWLLWRGYIRAGNQARPSAAN